MRATTRSVNSCGFLVPLRVLRCQSWANPLDKWGDCNPEGKGVLFKIAQAVAEPELGPESPDPASVLFAIFFLPLSVFQMLPPCGEVPSVWHNRPMAILCDLLNVIQISLMNLSRKYVHYVLA